MKHKIYRPFHITTRLGRPRVSRLHHIALWSPLVIDDATPTIYRVPDLRLLLRIGRPGVTHLHQMIEVITDSEIFGHQFYLSAADYAIVPLRFSALPHVHFYTKKQELVVS